MRKSQYLPLFKGFVIGINILAVIILIAGYTAGKSAGYGREEWIGVLEGKEYLDSLQYQEKASEAVYEAMTIMAKGSRLEKNGVYDPNRLVRPKDYLESGIVFDEVPAGEEDEGLYYRLGDLYDWSLRGTEKKNNVLNEAYKPLYYGSVQEFANKNNKEYHVLTEQIMDAIDKVQTDVTEYQEAKEGWSFEETNARYALRDMGSGNVCTNVQELLNPELTEEQFKAYFKQFKSYYIFDSRLETVEHTNVGDYHAYNTRELLEEQQVHTSGEYQVFVGIDTRFPVSDELSAGSEEIEEASDRLSPFVGPMGLSFVVIVLTLIWIIVRCFWVLKNVAASLLGNVNIVVRICIYFAAYELIQVLLRRVFGTGVIIETLLIIMKLAVLAALVWEGVQRQKLLEGVQTMTEGNGEGSIDTEGLFRDNLQMADAINELGEGLRIALKDQIKSEKMKADLITNVSHDLKTPLTSIINYVDLIKREQIDNPKVKEYLAVLDQKSQRLKQLTEDLVEASRVSSGNVQLDMQQIDLKEFLMQASGEFEEKFAAKGLKLVSSCPKGPVCVEADGRRLWRIIENLYRNVEKYAMPYTRVYMNLETNGKVAALSMKNISEQPLNISAEELMERFTRGDESRSTEGSGLGLSIAKDLTELQGGKFEIYLDGDLFKVTVMFPCKGRNK